MFKQSSVSIQWFAILLSEIECNSCAPSSFSMGKVLDYLALECFFKAFIHHSHRNRFIYFVVMFHCFALCLVSGDIQDIGGMHGISNCVSNNKTKIAPVTLSITSNHIMMHDYKSRHCGSLIF